MVSYDDNDNKALAAPAAAGSQIITIHDTAPAWAQQEEHPLQARLPYVMAWPRGAPSSFFETVCARYFEAAVPVNHFECGVLLLKAETVGEALRALDQRGLFATAVGRERLLGVIHEARATPWCKAEVLDEVERYTLCAFAIDPHTTRVSCGTLP